VCRGVSIPGNAELTACYGLDLKCSPKSSRVKGLVPNAEVFTSGGDWIRRALTSAMDEFIDGCIT
jgi:hypothetical protein